MRKNHNRNILHKEIPKTELVSIAPSSRFYWIGLSGIIVLALFLRLAGIWKSEPIDYHPDEWVLANPIFTLANDAETGMKTHYKWPGCGVIYLVGYLLYCMKWLFGPYSYNNILIILRIISAFASTGAVVAAFFLAKKLFHVRAALLAALFFAIAKVLVLHGHYGTLDSIVSLLILLVMLIAFELFDISPDHKQPDLKAVFCILLGVLCGWGIASKWTVILAAIPISGAFFLSGWAGRKSHMWKVFITTNAVRIFIILITMGIIYLASNPDFLMNPHKVIEGFTYEMIHNQTGHYGSVTSDKAALHERLGRTWNALSGCGNLFFLLAGIVSFLYCVKTLSRQTAFLVYSLLIWLWVLIRNLLAPERHHLVPYTFILLLISYMLGQFIFSRYRWLKVSTWVIIIFLSLSGLIYSCITISPFWKHDGRVDCANWIMENVPAGSGVTWAPRTHNWNVPGTRIVPELFQRYPREAEPGKYQYVIAAHNWLGIFRKHPPSRPIDPKEWFPSNPPSMGELQLYAEMIAGEGPNLTKVKVFPAAKPSFLGLDFSMFGMLMPPASTNASWGVTLYRFTNPRPVNEGNHSK